ncbi:TRAP transporter substrate-binding protein [Carnobacterium gallinarum]|uniref:TRAP transporter substrate-binding protein n=1 Tax=Carnobacterium gallinarum TaxID=2749 RepID=UPI000556F355|nr:TRAP transporter substrate-binding protein [Carnobacterium gallinarum]
MKKNRLKKLGFALGLSSLLFLTACSTKVAESTNLDEKIILRYAYASNSQPIIDSMNEFGRLVSEKTKGQVEIAYFPDGQLGGERELIELTQSGAVDFTKVSGSALESFSKKYSIFSVPYLFDNEAHFYRVMDDQTVMEPIYQSTKDLGFVGLTYYDSGQRSFYMVDKPITTPADLKGKKIRVMQSETAIKMVELLGGSPIPMGSDEVYTSMQSNLINGSENNEFVLVTAGHGAIAKYYSYDEHTRVPDIVIMNEETLSKLSKKQKEAIYEAAAESTNYEKKVFKKAVEKEKTEATEKYAVQFNEVDNQPFQEAVKPLHEQFANNPDFSELFTIIKNHRNQTK